MHDIDGTKLKGCSKVGRWLGFDPETKDHHRIYWPDRRSVSVERSVRFNFNDDMVVQVLPLKGESSDGSQSNTLTNEHISSNLRIGMTLTDDGNSNVVENPNSTKSLEPVGGRGKHIQKESEYVQILKDGSATTGQRSILPKGMWPCSVIKPVEESIEEEEHAMATVIESAEGFMPPYKEACKRLDWPKWEQTIRKELNSLKESGTWELVKCLPDTNIVDSKWVLQIKKNSVGEIEKYKARLVAKGFTQIYGVDYYETYAPVAKLVSFRILLTLATRNNWPVHTFDFDMAYLNCKLGEDKVVYIKQPPDYETKDRRYWVWRLWKALYGLKQSARMWYEALCKVLNELRFIRTEADHGVFFKKIGKDIIILAVHVDDCAVTGNSIKQIEQFKVDMDKKYKLIDMGPASFVGD